MSVAFCFESLRNSPWLQVDLAAAADHSYINSLRTCAPPTGPIFSCESEEEEEGEEEEEDEEEEEEEEKNEGEPISPTQRKASSPFDTEPAQSVGALDTSMLLELITKLKTRSEAQDDVIRAQGERLGALENNLQVLRDEVANEVTLITLTEEARVTEDHQADNDDMWEDVSDSVVDDDETVES
ncbi:hypothetical protein ACHAPT_013429 [Fusarium lateritium]